MTTQGRPLPPTAPLDLSPSAPDVLADRYHLGALLGRGGMADVYRAHDQVLGRDVAVKVFRRDAVTPDESARQSAEVRLLAGLNHPGLVSVYDAGTDDNGLGEAHSFLVLELVEGQSLGQRMTGGRLSPAEVADIGAQLAEALAYVHSRHVVHRDLKPGNVLLMPTPHRPADITAKLADFGIARLLDSTHLTTHGMTVGTANYLSPEQVQGHEVTVASDIYSLGLLLLECLTATLAYPGYGVEAALGRLHRSPEIPAWLGESWIRLLSAMTADNPADRPSAEHVANALRELRNPRDPATDAGTEVIGPAQPGEASAHDRLARTRVMPALPARARRPRKWLLVALAAIALVVAVGILVAITAGNSDGQTKVRPPIYPSVPGQLGRDLTNLQLSVQQ